jgi:hypothetical protein
MNKKIKVDDQVFHLENLEIRKDGYVAEGHVDGKSALLSGTSIIKSIDDLHEDNLGEWILDVEQHVTTNEEVAKILGITKNKAFRLINDNCLPAPVSFHKTKEKTYRRWDVLSVLKMKPFINMSKMELLQFIASNIDKLDDDE